MEAVRSIVLKTDRRIAERVKWNAPSFSYRIDLAAFHPRAQAFVHLVVVYPKDTVIEDATGLLEGNHKDRRKAKFHDMKDVMAKKGALQSVVKDWLKLVEQ